MTLDQIQALDAAHDFVPGMGTRNGLPESSYPFRGVRTGDKQPPPGYHRRDFRIPTLEQVMRTYPEVPLNIEIKGLADTDIASFQRNADLLAQLLNRIGRTEGIIVASFNDAALDRFHAQAPQIELAPSIADVAAFKLASVPLPEGMVAFQVPITFSGIPVTDAEMVQRAHAHDYGVHVWLSNDGENEEIYERLLGWNVDGIMAAEPGRLEGVLCEAAVPRPTRPAGWPGGPHCSPRSSIACETKVVLVAPVGQNRVRATLRRKDQFSGRCAGRIRLAARGSVLGRGTFDFGKLPPELGGPADLAVNLKLTKAARGPAGAAPRLGALSLPYDGFPARTRLLATDACGSQARGLVFNCFV